MDEFEDKLGKLLVRGLPGKQGGIVEARWLEPAELSDPVWSYRGADGGVSGLVLGYRGGRGVGCTDNRHVLTVAGSRGGKGVSLIVPNLLLYDGSVIAIDPKGELAAVTARARRAKGQNVVVLDPFGVSGVAASGSFNPLDQLDPEDPDVQDDAAQIADALIVPSEHEPHFTDAARILIEAIILYALTLPKADRNLVTVYQLLSGSHPLITETVARAEGRLGARDVLFKLMQQRKGVFDDVLVGLGSNFANMAERELASVYSTALTQLNFLKSKRLSATLTSSDLTLADIKRQKTTLYLCLPAMRMGTHARWLRVIINLALIAFERTKVSVDKPVLMVLDEFPVLGHMKAIETAAGLMAGFGVKLWIVVQDLTQIRRLYRDSWETFIGNAGVATFWSNSDKTTLEYISNKLGQTGVKVEQGNEITQSQRLSGSFGRREELRVQRLAAPDELERILDRRQRTILVMAAGWPPVILKRIVYYEDKPFAGQFDRWQG